MTKRITASLLVAFLALIALSVPAHPCGVALTEAQKEAIVAQFVEDGPREYDYSLPVGAFIERAYLYPPAGAAFVHGLIRAEEARSVLPVFVFHRDLLDMTELILGELVVRASEDQAVAYDDAATIILEILRRDYSAVRDG